MKVRVLLYDIEKPEEWIESFIKSSPSFLPKPEFIVAKKGEKVECDETYPYLIVSKEPIRVNNCFYLWSEPDINKAIIKALELSYSRPLETVSRRTLLTGKKALAYSRVPIVDETLCLSKFGCTRCQDACPKKAISIVEGKVNIDNKACDLCGLCVSSCPKGAITLTLPTWSAIAFISNFIRQKRIEKISIGCDESSDIVVNSLNAIGFEELVVLVSTGAKVEFRCEKEKEMISKLNEIVSNLYNNVHDVLSTELIGVKRKDYVRTVNNIKLDVNFGRNVFDLKVNDNCTVCGACMYRCPEGAIRVEYNNDGAFLYFNPQNCVGCNRCVKICAEKAIELVEVKETSKLFIDKELKFKDEAVRCKRCGRVFDNKRHLLKVASLLNMNAEELMYCPECRAQLTANKILESFKNKK